MEPESQPPWWSWAPNFPKPAIIALAIVVDLVIGGTWLYGIFFRGDATPYNPNYVWDVIINANPMANLATVLGLLQLNAEVIYMFLTKRRNLWEKERAVAKAKAEAEARAKAQAAAQAEAQAQARAAAVAETRAEARAWFEAWQKDPDQAPPPPWTRNGQEKE